MTQTTGKRVGMVFSAALLGLIHLVASYWAVMAWIIIIIPEDQYDAEAIMGAIASGFIAAFFAALASTLTMIPVSLGWLSRRWYVWPAAIVIASTIRVMMLIGAH